MHKQRCVMVVELGSPRYDMHLEFICVKWLWHYTAEASTGRSSSDSEESDSEHIQLHANNQEADDLTNEAAEQALEEP